MFGFEGRAVHTPHLDLLAAQGIRFSACITPNVVCMPARSSILTGLLPLTHGTHDNGIDLDEAIGARGFAGALRGVRCRDAKLTLELSSGAGELYDLREDPHECINRFHDPAYRGVRDELTQRLMSRPDHMRNPLPTPVGPA